MAEVHIIGRLASATGFASPSLFCAWKLTCGGGWRVLNGSVDGQTQTDIGHFERCANFSHPIDVHLSARTIQGWVSPICFYSTPYFLGWPQLSVQVWHEDTFGRQQLCAYGSVHVPTSPGHHRVSCACWRLAGTIREEVLHRLVGGSVQSPSVDALQQSGVKVTTVAMGTVHFDLGIILRHFDKFGVDV
jgi:B9 domain-containing protein 2